MAPVNLELVIDGDGHIVEEREGILRRMPRPYQEEARVRSSALFPPVDHLHSANLQTLPPGAFAQVGPEGWLAFMDDVGIDRVVLYPSDGLRYGMILSQAWAVDLARAYNDWLQETYSQRSKRFIGIGLIPFQEPQAAVEELRRIVTVLGMPGAMLPTVGPKAPLGSKEYWPLYAEADRLGCALAIHGGVHVGLGMDQLTPYPPAHALGHPFGLMINLGSIVFNGVCDRFPNARIGFLEGGVSWLLTCLERFNRSYETHTTYDVRGEFLRLEKGERVSDYILRHIKAGRIFIGCEGSEAELGRAVKVAGSEPFFYSSDFPHEVNNEICKHELRDVRENEELTPEEKAAVLHQNAQRFYRLTPSAS